MEKFRKTIAMVTVLMIGCMITYGIVEYNSQKELKHTTIQNNKSLAMYIEDESGNYQLSSSKEFPKEGYVLNLEKSSCKNGGVLSQDETTKGINLRTSGSDACNLYFEKEKFPLLDTIMSKRNNDAVTEYTAGEAGEMYTFDHDEATQTTGWSESERRDYRYIGKTPNNWVKFNGEDWRIVGVFTVETSSGTKEQLIKIIRNKSIGNIAWDSDKVNEWPSSSLKALLNEGDYYSRANTYSSTGLNETAKSQIEEVMWYLGGSTTDRNLGGPAYYNFERGETVYSGRSTNVIAKVGLMYPSDYVYTYANGVDSKCYTDGYNCDTGQKTNGWLYNNDHQWTISPNAAYSGTAFLVLSAGCVDDSNVYSSGGVRPSVYLKSSVKIVNGDGSSSENSYILG